MQWWVNNSNCIFYLMNDYQSVRDNMCWYMPWDIRFFDHLWTLGKLTDFIKIPTLGLT